MQNYDSAAKPEHALAVDNVCKTKTSHLMTILLVAPNCCWTLIHRLTQSQTLKHRALRSPE